MDINDTKSNVRIGDLERAKKHIHNAEDLLPNDFWLLRECHVTRGMISCALNVKALDAIPAIDERLTEAIENCSVKAQSVPEDYTEAEAELCAAWLCLHPEYNYHPESRPIAEVSA